MTPCRATHDTHTCCRTDGGTPAYRIPHPAPHMAHDGTQWDENGVRRSRGNDPYRGQVR